MAGVAVDSQGRPRDAYVPSLRPAAGPTASCQAPGAAGKAAVAAGAVARILAIGGF